MVSSQDTAVAAALHELGYKLPLHVEVVAVTKGVAGRRQAAHAGTGSGRSTGSRSPTPSQVSKAIQRAGVGTPVTFVVRRDGATQDASRSRRRRRRTTREGASSACRSARLRLPVRRLGALGDDIGGPSAGLIFSLGVYDTLTPGSLTGGTDIAGTGNHRPPTARVGPIGGIQQKIVPPRTRAPRSSSCRRPTATTAARRRRRRRTRSGS